MKRSILCIKKEVCCRRCYIKKSDTYRKNAPLFSLIIPVYKEMELIHACMERLINLEDVSQCEVIVVDGDGGSTLRALQKRTYPFQFHTINTKQGRGAQLHEGALASSGSILIFLHVDVQLPKNGLALLRSALENHPAGAFNLGIDSKRYFLQLGRFVANLRSRVTRVPYGDQVHFIRREAYFNVGGYRDIPIMEDVALMLALRKRGVSIIILKEKVVASDRRWRKEGMLRATFKDWILYTSYRMGVPAQKLAAKYRPHNE
jgi:rSAM/selenodomain-associated transferase 2